MKNKNGKKYTNTYCPEFHSEWKLLRANAKINMILDKLTDWEASHFASNFPASNSDWAKCNENFLLCLKSLSISEYSWWELKSIVKAAVNSDEAIKIEIRPNIITTYPIFGDDTKGHWNLGWDADWCIFKEKSHEIVNCFSWRGIQSSQILTSELSWPNTK